MKLAISNLAWDKRDDIKVAPILQYLGIEAVEIAPTKVWQNPAEARDDEIQEYRYFWESHGIRIIAMQSLLFGRPELTIFGNSNVRRLTITYLSKIIKLANKLGARYLVFGSPKNRQVSTLPTEEIESIAVSFFRELGEISARHDVFFCIEPNPRKLYGCNFITTAKEGIDLVKKVNNPGFRLHLDSACMTLAGDHISKSIQAASSYLSHFHASEPLLAEIDFGEVKHQEFSQALRLSGYSGHVSVETKPAKGEPVDTVIMRVMEKVKSLYGYGTTPRGLHV